MKNILLSIFFATSALTAAAQLTGNVKKAYAYYTITLPGMQMADENGNPITPKPAIGRFIYFEWSAAKKPVIETVIYNKQVLIATLTPVKGKSVVPGREFSKNNISKITVNKLNSLWKIELQPKEGNSMPEADCKNITIRVKESKYSFSVKLIKETLLETMPRY